MIDNKIRVKKLQNDINIATTKMSSVSSGEIIQEAKPTYSALGDISKTSKNYREAENIAS